MTGFDRLAGGLPVRFRDNGSNPRSGTCALHLRRICGVCPHFEGGGIRASGRCGLLGRDVSGRSDAARCEHWERRLAGADG
jgi:hypothetical protein